MCGAFTVYVIPFNLITLNTYVSKVETVQKYFNVNDMKELN
jgi:hypothetical protein